MDAGCQRHPVDVEIELPLGHGERHGVAALHGIRDIVDEPRVERGENDILDPVDLLARPKRQDLRGIAVRVDAHPTGELAAVVQPLGIRCTDFDPRRLTTRGVANEHGGLVRRRDAFAERDAVLVLEAVRQQAGDEEGRRLGRMLTEPQREVLVDPAIEVRHLHVEGMHHHADLACQAVEVLELRRLTLELARSNRQLAHFAGRVSHDLRNPLLAIVGHLDLAAEGIEAGDTARTSRALTSAESAALRMGDTITGLLSYARLGGAQPAATPVPVRTMLADALADLDATIRVAEATVVVDAADDELVGDAALLRILVQNLVANAVKYSAGAGVRPQIRVTARRDDDAWSLTVDDNGPGIAPPLRERVFDVMERGDAGDVPGLGIGLATCRLIAEAHNGRIAIDDAPGGGARLRLTLLAERAGGELPA
ncbi:MAG: hypothetical protein DI577_01675 [Microbacterium sp.]|nr:MAG: hypothetical protein DI577_01675 [Microbacterium sp.]PZU37975.1 MAG: hypothetical protein DI575_01675 [Microbacterium sp.]